MPPLLHNEADTLAMRDSLRREMRRKRKAAEVASRLNAFSATIDLLVVGLTLAAVAMGGSTLLWEQALLTLGAGLLMLVSPPSGRLPWYLNALFASLMVLAAIPLLPAGWLPELAWRQTLVTELTIPLSGLYSPQPWITLEHLGLLLSGTVWIAFLLSRQWELPRRTLLETLIGGVFAMTVVAIGLYFTGTHFSLWPTEAISSTYFGFFPTRNQTASLLGIAGVVAFALTVERLREKDWLALIWAVAYVAIGFALVVNYSRAGILIYFIGSFLWLVAINIFSKNYFAMAVGLTVLFLMLALFAVFGGETWQRFRPGTDTTKPVVTSTVVDFRQLVHKDALQMGDAASWHGFGLGNFEAAFARYRNSSVNEIRAKHPDSDWLWLWMEMGWPAMLVAVAIIGFAIRPCFPFGPSSDRRLRVACTVAAILFILHGIVDVSGHRMGTVFPAALLLALARNPDSIKKGTPQAALSFRLLGGVLAAIAVVWFASAVGVDSLPTSAALTRLKSEIQRAEQSGNAAIVIEDATRALRIAPLDWELYLSRAIARTKTSPNDPETTLDFKRARHLEPMLASVPFREGAAWMDKDLKAALSAWREALRRAGRNAPPMFGDMMRASANYPSLREGLWWITGEDARLRLMVLQECTPDEFKVLMRLWMLEDPLLKTTDAIQLKQIFALWYAKGDRTQLEENLKAIPEWQEVGWYWLAEIATERKDFKRAYELAHRYVQAPRLPPRNPGKSLGKLEREAAQRPNDFVLGLALYMSYLQEQRLDQALATVKRMTALPQCPKYFLWLEAELLARLNGWEQAWFRMKQYVGDNR